MNVILTPQCEMVEYHVGKLVGHGVTRQHLQLIWIGIEGVTDSMPCLERSRNWENLVARIRSSDENVIRKTCEVHIELGSLRLENMIGGCGLWQKQVAGNPRTIKVLK